MPIKQQHSKITTKQARQNAAATQQQTKHSSNAAAGKTGNDFHSNRQFLRLVRK
jgi:hypothetical protein